MADWGNNPATGAAVGSLATLLTLIFLALSYRIANKTASAAARQADTAAQDTELRRRPWIGAKNISWDAPPEGDGPYLITVEVSNFGLLIGHDVHVLLYAGDVSTAESRQTHDIELGAIFPTLAPKADCTFQNGHDVVQRWRNG